MGKTELRGQELLEAAETHDALFSFDARARAASSRPACRSCPTASSCSSSSTRARSWTSPSSLRAVWTSVERAGGSADRVGLELMGAERYPDPELLAELVDAHRERGAVISLDDLSVGTEALTILEALKPDVAKLSLHLCKGIETSPARRHLVGALVEVAHELGVRVVAVGIERDFELEHIQELGIDLGQGFYLGQPNEEMLPVDRGWSPRHRAPRRSPPPGRVPSGPGSLRQLRAHAPGDGRAVRRRLRCGRAARPGGSRRRSTSTTSPPRRAPSCAPTSRASRSETSPWRSAAAS